MSTEQMARIEHALGRIEQKIDGHLEVDRLASSQQMTINADLYAKYATQDQFRSRVKGVAKGASVMVGLIAGVVGLYAKVKGAW